jgi:hypothetical protein
LLECLTVLGRERIKTCADGPPEYIVDDGQDIVSSDDMVIAVIFEFGGRQDRYELFTLPIQQEGTPGDNLVDTGVSRYTLRHTLRPPHLVL